MYILLLILGIVAFAVTVPLILCVLKLVTAWKVFEKYGEPGWHGLIPIYSDYKEYGHCWNVGAFLISFGAQLISGAVSEKEGFLFSLIAIAAGLVAIVFEIMFAKKKSHAFGGGLGLATLIFFVPFIANLYIGFGNCRYLGNRN